MDVSDLDKAQALQKEAHEAWDRLKVLSESQRVGMYISDGWGDIKVPVIRQEALQAFAWEIVSDQWRDTCLALKDLGVDIREDQRLLVPPARPTFGFGASPANMVEPAPANPDKIDVEEK